MIDTKCAAGAVQQSAGAARSGGPRFSSMGGGTIVSGARAMRAQFPRGAAAEVVEGRNTSSRPALQLSARSLGRRERASAPSGIGHGENVHAFPTRAFLVRGRRRAAERMGAVAR